MGSGDTQDFALMGSRELLGVRLVLIDRFGRIKLFRSLLQLLTRSALHETEVFQQTGGGSWQRQQDADRVGVVRDNRQLAFRWKQGAELRRQQPSVSVDCFFFFFFYSRG